MTSSTAATIPCRPATTRAAGGFSAVGVVFAVGSAIMVVPICFTRGHVHP